MATICRTQSDPVAKVRHFELIRRWLGTQDRGHLLRLVVVRTIRPFVELLNIRKEQRSFRVRFFGFAAHHAIEVPEDFKLFRNDGVSAKDASSGEVRLEALKHNHVRSENKKSLRVVPGYVILLAGGVEELPCDRESHHLRLAASRGHLDAIPGEVIERRQPKIA